MTEYERLIIEHRKEQRSAARKPTRHKYGAIATTVDDIRFDSKAEARRYQELKLMEKGRLIRNLELQAAFPLVVNGVKIGRYDCDFRYVDCVTGKMVVEDVKSEFTAKNPVYRLKKKLVEAIYGIVITEVVA
jgi:hypothetical protein